MIIFDTNVIIDIATRDPQWAGWSLAMREAAELRGGAAINDVIFAELCVRYERREAAKELLDLLDLTLLQMPREALFLAAKAFQRYRESGGRRTNVLPHFFIGAQASVLGTALVTRDPRPYRTYFPRLEVISP